MKNTTAGSTKLNRGKGVMFGFEFIPLNLIGCRIAMASGFGCGFANRNRAAAIDKASSDRKKEHSHVRFLHFNSRIINIWHQTCLIIYMLDLWKIGQVKTRLLIALARRREKLPVTLSSPHWHAHEHPLAEGPAFGAHIHCFSATGSAVWVKTNTLRRSWLEGRNFTGRIHRLHR